MPFSSFLHTGSSSSSSSSSSSEDEGDGSQWDAASAATGSFVDRDAAVGEETGAPALGYELRAFLEDVLHETAGDWLQQQQQQQQHKQQHDLHEEDDDHPYHKHHHHRHRQKQQQQQQQQEQQQQQQQQQQQEELITFRHLVLVAAFTTTADCAAAFLQLPAAMNSVFKSLIEYVQDENTKYAEADV